MSGMNRSGLYPPFDQEPEPSYNFLFKKKLTASDIETKLMIPTEEAIEHFPNLSMGQSIEFLICELEDNQTWNWEIKKYPEGYCIRKDFKWHCFARFNHIREGDSLLFFKLIRNPIVNDTRPDHGVRVEKMVEIRESSSAENPHMHTDTHTHSAESGIRQEVIHESIFKKKLSDSDQDMNSASLYPPYAVQLEKLKKSDENVNNRGGEAVSAEEFCDSKNEPGQVPPGDCKKSEEGSSSGYSMSQDRKLNSESLKHALAAESETRQEGNYESIFKKELSGYHVCTRFTVPKAHVKKFFDDPNNNKPVNLQVYDFDQKRNWEWKLKKYGECWRIQKNWKKFAKANELKEGDFVEFFKLQNNDQDLNSVSLPPPYAVQSEKKKNKSDENVNDRGGEAVSADKFRDGKNETGQAPPGDGMKSEDHGGLNLQTGGSSREMNSKFLKHSHSAE